MTWSLTTFNVSLPLEGARTRALLKYLNGTWGGYWVKIHGSRFQASTVDILGCWWGFFVALEVKRPGKHPTPRQALTLEQIQNAGGVASVVWSNDDCQRIFLEILDREPERVYIPSTGAKRSDRRIEERENTIMATAAKTSKRAAKIADDEDDDLDDLEDLDELDDLEDEDEEDEEDAPPVKTRATRTTKVAKATPGAQKASAAKNRPAAAKKNGASNLTPRRVPEGMAGASEVAKEVGTDARSVRVIFRKKNVAKGDSGTYAWKTGSRDFQRVVKVVRDAMKESK